MTNATFVARDEKFVSKNYGPLPVAIDRGERIYVWDAEGRRYIDCLAGYGAMNQGHCHPKILKAMIEQAQKVTLTSRAFHNTQMGALGEYMTELLGYEKLFPMNTGCEADETACKMARRWAYREKGTPDNQAMILFPTNNFWGRSITASGACDDPARYHQFGPFTEGFELFKFNDLADLEAKLKANPHICAVFIEPIQGEGGVIVPHEGYLQGVRDLCTKYNALMCADEVQTGFGRTGDMMAVQHEKVKPDILCMGKSMSGGMYPVSGCMVDDFICKHIGPGDHGSTYGGNPLGMATALAAVKTLVEEGMTENARKMGALFQDELRKVKSPLVKEVRGRGLFIGVEIDQGEGIKVDGNNLAKMFYKHGLLTKATHDHTVRLTPALVINESEVMNAVEIYEKALRDLEAMNTSLN